MMPNTMSSSGVMMSQSIAPPGNATISFMT